MTSSAEASPMRVTIGLFLLTVMTFLGYWLVLDQQKHTQSIAYNQRGNTFSEQGRYDEAIKNYQQAIKIRVNFAEPYNNLANALVRKGKLQEPVSYYKKAIQLKR